MMKWIPVALTLILSGCSSEPVKTYYQLPALDAPQATDVITSPRQLWLEHINLADFLAQSGVVYQSSDVQYVIAQNNLWASALDQQLQQTLVANLSQALPGWLVSPQSMGSEQDTLNVTVSGFHGRYDGKVIIRGEWVFNHHGRLSKHPFSLELKQEEDGYDGLIRVLAQGWQQEAKRIAEQISLL